MNYKLLMYSCFVAILLNACTEPKGEGEISLKSPPQDTLFAKKVNLSEDVFQAGKILLENDNLIFFDRVGRGKFKVFKYPHFEHVFDYPAEDEGPNMHSFIDFNSMSAQGGYLSYLDYPYYRKIRVNTDGNTFDHLDYIDLSKIDQDINRVVQLNDELYVTMNFTPDLDEYEHLLYSGIDAKVLKKFGDYPETTMDFESPMSKSMYFLYSAVSNIAEEKIAVFYRNVNIIRFYDFDGNLEKEIEVGSYKEPSIAAEQTVFFIEPQAADDRILVLYLNENNDYAVNNLEKIRPELHAYTWSGELLYRCFIDAPVYTFGVSDKGDKLIAATHWEDNPIIEINLPE
jgi:hypothetical protein